MSFTLLHHTPGQEARARARVIVAAEGWLRTPHEHGACVPGAGVDCGRLLIAVFAGVGLIEEFDPGPYAYDYHLHRNEERYLPMVERFAAQVERAPLPGDLALFRFGRVISHGAIITAWPAIIHAHVRQGVVRDAVDTNVDLREHFAGIWSLWPTRAEAAQLEAVPCG